MKLLTRVTLYYLLISLLVFSAGGYFFYVIFKDEIYEELDEQIRDEKRNLERLLQDYDSIPPSYSGINYSSLITPSTYSGGIEKKDTTIIHPFEGKQNFRQWRFSLSGNSKDYTVVIRKSQIDIEDLAEQIIYAMAHAYLAFVLVAIAGNYLLLKRIFRPFYRSLGKLRAYSVDTLTPLSLPHSSTKEFDELNNELNQMSERIVADYINTRQFTENASHEIQTPLTIIRNKLELLMQSSSFNGEEADLINSCYEATNRLSRLVSSLILLTKIENREYKADDSVNLYRLAIRMASQMKEEFEMKEINVSIEEGNSTEVLIHAQLAEIMVRNLLSNALRHTPPGGKMIIRSNDSFLSIENTGPALPFEPERIFERFFYSGKSSHSMGIGLSLVRKIAGVFHLEVKYSFYEGKHGFSIVSLP